MALKKTRVKRRVTQALRRSMTPEDAQEVIAEVAIEVQQKVETQPKIRTPGSIVAGSKVAYTYQDLCKMFPIVTFTPEETIGLTFQGIRVQALEGKEMHVPKCFKNIYDQHRAAMRYGARGMPQVGYVNVEELGAGALPSRATE